MVVKKYLCAAPRPESWEEKGEALLKALGGDKMKCQRVARQTLGMLKERHKHEKKRAGPGRKSNAEHAIAFYEYLVGVKGSEDKEKSEDGAAQSSDDDDSSSSSSSDQSSASKTIDTEEFLDQHDDTCEVCNLGGELICCSTCTLVFHEDCIRPVLKSIPSDWICPHCITQGINSYKRHSKTWKAAASGIRQMKRMKMEIEMERGPRQRKEKSTQREINNEYADKTNEEESIADNTTRSEKVKSLTNNDIYVLEDQQETNHRDFTGIVGEKDAAAVGGNTSAASSVSSTGAGSDSKRNLALYKIADSYTNNTETLLLRGRRQRKQPSLYQPQLCADSRWKSDEKNLETDGNDHDDTDISDAETNIETDSGKKDQDESKVRRSNSRRVFRTNKARNVNNQMEDNVVICIGEDTVDRKKIGSPFCSFCHDDASILICVFCGCRVCFGKHDKSTLLLCDNCDDEYHILCLGLTTVPSAQKWFCPTCAKTKSATTPKMLSTRRASSTLAQSSDVEVDSETDYSKRSSPNKKSRSSTTMATRTPTALAKRTTDVEVLDKRNRGRPSKLKVDTLSPRKRVRTPKAFANSVETLEQRKRCKQSKSTTNTPATTSSVGKKRGRPAKNAPTFLSKSPPAPRKRGRPPKANPDPIAIPSKVDSAIKKKVPKLSTPSSIILNKVSNVGVSEVPAKPQESIKVSRVSGRTVKRASFHDEVDEGEQHLRSSKSPQSGDSQSTNNTLKVAPSKSQEAQTHRTSSKAPELSEPQRKKQRLEEKTPTQTKATPSETKSTKSQIKTPVIIEDKEEEMTEPPPIAPVRMKPVLQPPAQPIAPVRMKPVLQPPTPIIRPLVSVPESPSSIEKKGSNAEGDKKSIIGMENKVQEKNKAKDLQVDAAPTIIKSEASKKMPPPPPMTLPPKINKPAATVASKAAAPTSATTRVSSTFTQEVPSSRSTTGTSTISHYPSTPLLDPVALEAAVKALPEPKETKGEKTGTTKTPRRKPGARECMQISRRFGVNIIPEKYMTILLDYCRRGKVEHLIKMRERLDCHSRFLEYQLAGLEARVKEVGESNVVVPAMPPHKRDSSARHRGGGVSPPPNPLNKRAALSGSTAKAAIATQASRKKLPLASQASGTASSEIKTESTVKKLPVKPNTGPKHPISSSITTTAKPALPVPLANKTKTEL